MWTDSPVTASRSGLRELVGCLWRDAARIDLALADPGWLVEILPSDRVSGPTVRAVVDGDPRDGGPGWRLWLASEPPSPEMILAYPDGAGFPALAVLLGGAPDDPLAVVQRRPLVLRRLLERFERMILQATPALFRRGTGLIGPSPELAVRIREQARGDSAQLESDTEATLKPETGTTAVDLYRLVLVRHFGELDDIEVAQLAAHQKCALERASAMIDRYGGVIVADAVGLGKTFVGLGLLEAARSEARRALVITPASLRAQWRRHLGYLAGAGDLGPEATGADDRQLAFQEDTRQVELTSMESLGRSSFDPSCFEHIEFVLVDEAHNFRNPSTNRYRALAKIVRHAKVALLTATPINNSLLDLSALIDLFAAPGAFRHLGVSNYRVSFRRSAVDDEVRKVVAACVVRRTRRFLRAHYGPITIRDPHTGQPRELRFPRRLPPGVISYDLGGTYGELLGGLETWLDSLRFPSANRGAEPSSDQAGAEALMKIILLKRLESSVQAFRRSIIQQLAWCDTALRALASGRVLTRPDYRASFRGPTDDPGSQLALFELMLPPASINADDLHRFRQDLQRDRDMLAGIHRRLSGLVGAGSDRKLEALRRILTEDLFGHKVIIFTEFRDTARYLHRQLRDLPHMALVDSGQARLGLEPATRAEVITRFAPISNDVPEPPTIERVDTLIATDVLSEGLNLQDASVVVSYDLPWNPVTLMQRLGRVDRLGSLADVVQPFCFVPADQLDRLLGLMDRLQRKVNTIGAAFGLEQIVIPGLGAADVNDSDRVKRLLSDPRELDRLEDELDAPPDPEELAYIDHVRLSKGSKTELPSPPATAIVTPGSSNVARRSDPVVVSYWHLRWAERVRGLWIVYDPETRCVTEDSLTAVESFRWASDGSDVRHVTVGNSGSDVETGRHAEILMDHARQAFARFASAELARVEAARIAGDRLVPTLPQCRIAAWLARLLERDEFRLDPETRRRIDGIATGLARRFTSQTERTLAVIADDLPQGPDSQLLDRLERVLSASGEMSIARGSVEEIGTLLLFRSRNTGNSRTSPGELDGRSTG